MIKHVSLAHGWFYHYRIHTPKASELCSNGYSKLKSYLETTMEACPDEHFTEGPRSSCLRFSLPIKLKEDYNHEVIELASQGLKNLDNYKTGHSKVQMFMLQFDKNTISIETPIWMHNKEMNNFEDTFNSQSPLSGHIDVLRVEPDNKVWIWDYKPKAEKERYASTQVFFYALMMSKRTGLPLSKFRCGYFDDEIAYTFKPEMKLLKNI
ncbi:PD-(D/E)XK nuclease family protein [Bacteroidota bacterium]